MDDFEVKRLSKEIDEEVSDKDRLESNFYNTNMFDTHQDLKSYSNHNFTTNFISDLIVMVLYPKNIFMLLLLIVSGLVSINLLIYTWDKSIIFFFICLAIIIYNIFVEYVDYIVDFLISISIFVILYFIFKQVNPVYKLKWLFIYTLTWLIIYRYIVVFLKDGFSKKISKLSESISSNEIILTEIIRDRVISIVNRKGLVDTTSVKQEDLSYVNNRYIDLILKEAADSDVLECINISNKDNTHTTLYKTKGSINTQYLKID